jgi:predicted secreted hydrolase
MLYRLRRHDGSVDPLSGGTYVAPDGTPQRLIQGAPNGPTLTPGRTWHSTATGARYPLVWRLDWPERNLSLWVEPMLDNQELTPTAGIPFPYWEGAVAVSGERAGRAIAGEGYLELTGYGGELAPALR